MDDAQFAADSSVARPAAGTNAEEVSQDDVQAMLEESEETLEQEQLLIKILRRQSDGLRARLGMELQKGVAGRSNRKT